MSAPPRVLHVLPSSAAGFGGPLQAVAGYVRAATHRGMRCAVLVPSSTPADEASLAAEMQPASLHVERGYGHGAFVASPALQRRLRRDLARADVMHVHGLLNPISTLAARTALAEGMPLVIRPFGTLSRFTRSHRRRMMKALYLRLFDVPNLRRAGAVHFTTEEELREAGEWRPELARRGFVIPPPLIETPPARDDATVAPTVLFLSRLHPKKNLETLIDAWPSVLGRVPAARLIIAGSGDEGYVHRLEQRVRSRGTEAAVTFAGHVQGPAKDELLRRAAVFVLPSFHENFGVAVLEAMAAGMPVVISHAVQLASFVTAHDAGTITGTDAASVGAALASLLGDEARRSACGRRAHAAAVAHFSAHAVADRIAAMYDAAIRFSSHR